MVEEVRLDEILDSRPSTPPVRRLHGRSCSFRESYSGSLSRDLFISLLIVFSPREVYSIQRTSI
jgi:hypothetical protein